MQRAMLFAAAAPRRRRFFKERAVLRGYAPPCRRCRAPQRGARESGAVGRAREQRSMARECARARRWRGREGVCACASAVTVRCERRQAESATQPGVVARQVVAHMPHASMFTRSAYIRCAAALRHVAIVHQTGTIQNQKRPAPCVRAAQCASWQAPRCVACGAGKCVAVARGRCAVFNYLMIASEIRDSAEGYLPVTAPFTFHHHRYLSYDRRRC